MKRGAFHSLGIGLTLFLLILCLSPGPARAQSTQLGRSANDLVLPQFWTQQSNAGKTVQGLNSNAGTNRFSDLLLPTRLDGHTLTNVTLGGTVAITNGDVSINGDPVSPNTNRTRSFFFSNFGSLENSQVDTVSWYGQKLGQIYGGTTIVGAYTNLIIDAPDTYGDFTDVTKLWAVGPIDAVTGLRVTRAYTLDQLGLTDSSFSGKVLGIDASTKRVTKSSVAITDVASAAETSQAGNITSGTLAAARLPAFSGDATSSVGSSALTIPAGTVTDSKSALEVKPACAVVAASNLTLSGEQTIDGVTTSGSLVLATAQSTGSQNGPWLTASGAWTRPTWFTSGSTSQAPRFCSTFIRLGSTYQGSTWRMTTAGVTINTTSQTWVQTPYALNAGSVTGTLPAANNAAIPAASGTGTNTILIGATIANTLTINKASGSNAPFVISNGGTWVDPTLPTIPVLIIRPANTSTGGNIDLMPNFGGIAATNQTRVALDILSRDIVGVPTGLTNQTWLHLAAEADDSYTVSGNGGVNGTIGNVNIANSGGNVGIGSFGPDGANRVATHKLQVRPNTDINWGISYSGSSVVINAKRDNGTTFIPVAYRGTSHFFSADQFGTQYVFAQFRPITNVNVSLDNSGTSGRVAFFNDSAGAIDGIFQGAGFLFTDGGGSRTSGTQFHPATDINQGYDAAGSAFRQTFFNDSGVKISSQANALSFNWSSDNASTWGMAFTNNTVTAESLSATSTAATASGTLAVAGNMTVGGSAAVSKLRVNATKNYFSYDTTDVSLLFAQFRPATNVNLTIDNVGTAARIAALTDSYAAEPIIMQGSSINFTSSSGSTYGLVLSNEVVTAECITAFATQATINGKLFVTSIQGQGANVTCTGATMGASSFSPAGFVTATTTGTSTIVLTFPVAATHAWSVCVNNQTIGAAAIRMSASNTTTATLTGVTVSGDVINYIAVSY